MDGLRIQELPGDVCSLATLVARGVDLLLQHAGIDLQYFERWAELRPKRRQEIFAISGELGFVPSQASLLERIKTLVARDRNSPDPHGEISRLVYDADETYLSILFEIADAVAELDHSFLALMAGETAEGTVTYIIAPSKPPIFLSLSLVSLPSDRPTGCPPNGQSLDRDGLDP